MTTTTTQATASDHLQQIAAELSVAIGGVRAVIDLLAEGATIPFIARYRKEATGSLDEVVIARIRDRLQQMQELDKRRKAILDSLTERSLLTDELKKRIESAAALAELEDIYLPYRVKRKTRATAAKEKGLEPLAQAIFSGKANDPKAAAAKFINEGKGVANADDALAGARDIIAEWINEDEAARKEMRTFWSRKCILSSTVQKGKDVEGAKFRDYFDWSEPVTSIPSHRILAMLRGETEDVLKLKLAPPDVEAQQILERRFIRGRGPAWDQGKLAAEDAYKRLLAPSMETELRSSLKERADDEAIQVFVRNVRELLMSPPLGQKNVLGVDPGFRTGCKLVCLDRQGKLLHNDVIYPHTEGSAAAQSQKSAAKVIDL
ncbi:MAG TPA: Tex-like N-terminal domain-containing protein, partial [Trichormus sp.]